jgi:hypothetical protein
MTIISGDSIMDGFSYTVGRKRLTVRLHALNYEYTSMVLGRKTRFALNVAKSDIQEKRLFEQVVTFDGDVLHVDRYDIQTALCYYARHKDVVEFSNADIPESLQRTLKRFCDGCYKPLSPDNVKLSWVGITDYPQETKAPKTSRERAIWKATWHGPNGHQRIKIWHANFKKLEGKFPKHEGGMPCDEFWVALRKQTNLDMIAFQKQSFRAGEWACASEQ